MKPSQLISSFRTIIRLLWLGVAVACVVGAVLLYQGRPGMALVNLITVLLGLFFIGIAKRAMLSARASG